MAQKKVLVLGAGGREHALVSTLARSSSRPQVFCAPGNAGIGIEAELVGVPIAQPGFEELIDFVRTTGVDLTIVGPEAPLVDGIVDRFEAAGLRIFGPSARAARLEGSKCFTKEFLARHEIPTAPFRIFEDAADARRHVETVPLPVVLKADGLAAGKGVIVAEERQEALDAVQAIMVDRHFGDAGKRMIVEDCLEGSELSLLVLCDGEEHVPLETAQDYKPVFDGGRGPNTGGMGSYSPYRSLGDAQIQKILNTIVRPTLDGLRQEGVQYRGVLYAGLMLTASGPSVLEFNVRFGDPEAQPILLRLRTDFLELVESALTPGGLARTVLDWDPRAAVCVVAASEGYPGSYPKGRTISGLGQADEMGDVKVFHAGTARTREDEIATAGGRVLGVTALGGSREEARQRAYEAVDLIHFDGMHYRKDIARV